MIGQLNDHSIGIIMKEIVRRAITTIRNERLAFEVHAKPGHSGEMDDILTTADIKAQSVYLRSIRECFPDCGLIAEEDDLAIPSGNGAYFTVDPLDGTRAFARRQSHGIGSMLALVCDGDARGKHVAAAFIGDINTEEIYGYRPGSSRVHRINQYNTWSELQYEGRAGKAGYILLRDPPSYYSPASRAMIERYDNHLVDGGSIGIWLARLWKREVTAALIPPGWETPWDSTPVIGISQQLGYVFARPGGTGWEIYEPPLPQEKLMREHDTLIIHAMDWDTIRRAAA